MKNRLDAGGSTFCKSIEASDRQPIRENDEFRVMNDELKTP
jgi:hypothetical protein